ncbi:5-hydroxymethyl-dUMP N-hydrolase isoform X1 [Saccopteryx bilineata]|uniref:5-hydroxymethyl-dUMP N-hydrolase isoform X1 n=1 Tax=Saccopteryx bilineata TaxID=59482 RepID=UPI00338F5938
MADAGERGAPGQSGKRGRLALYFCGSIRGGREDRPLYERIVSRLRRFGTVLTEHVAAADLSAWGEEAAGGDRLIHQRDLAWLQQADLVVAEVTQPSLGVGYELGRAVALNKRVLCLFRPKSGRDENAEVWTSNGPKATHSVVGPGSDSESLLFSALSCCPEDAQHSSAPLQLLL